MSMGCDGVKTPCKVLTKTLCAFLLCLASACTDAPVENQSAAVQPTNKAAPIKAEQGKAVPPRQGLVIKRYVASVLRTAGSVPCSISLNSEMIHCTERLNWPSELQAAQKANIQIFGGANTALHSITGYEECKIDACVHLGTVENLSSRYDLAAFVRSGAWTMDVIYIDTSLIAYRFFEFRVAMNTVITYCYIVDDRYFNRTGRNICKKP